MSSSVYCLVSLCKVELEIVLCFENKGNEEPVPTIKEITDFQELPPD
jgi:hypothetical protein